MRLATDPRVRVVLRALDRSILSASTIRDGTVVSFTMANVLLYALPGTLTTDEVIERFVGWPDDAVRAVLLAFALNCPEADLLRMARAAREEVRTIVDMEREFAAQDARGAA